MLAQHRFAVEAILQDALAVVTQLPAGTPAAQAALLEQQLRVVRQCADELRRVGSSSTGVPF